MAQATFANAVQKSAAHAAEVSLQLLYIKHACELVCSQQVRMDAEVVDNNSFDWC